MTLTLGEFLLIQRRRRGWSRRKLARKAGVTSISVELIEHNCLRAPIGQLNKVCLALGYNVDIRLTPKEK